MKVHLKRFIRLVLLVALLMPFNGMVSAQGSVPPAPSTKGYQPQAAYTIYLPVSLAVLRSSADPTTYVQATFGEPQTLDPALDYETAGASVLINLYDTLIFYERENPNVFVPQLATEVPSLANGGISPDGKTYTFKIRPGVKFHDGSLMTPSDVAYTFQRGILQGGSVSPQWLLTEPLLGNGIYDIAELIDPALVDDPEMLAGANPAELLAACQTVSNAIVADDAAGTVTFHLAQAWAPFLAILAQPWGSIQSQDWMIASGGWDHNCATWQNYYGIYPDQSSQTLLGSEENGTGPYRLYYWNPGVEIVLKANQDYWRAEAAWTGGPSGSPVIQTAIIKNVSDEAVRLAMLNSGEADSADILSTDFTTLDAQTALVCNPDDSHCVPGQNPRGFFEMIQTQSHNRTDAFFTWQINTDGGNAFIGSGQMDGAGIPPDFFSDPNVRKGFAYCFNYDQYLQDVHSGEGIRSIDVMLPGMSGYNENDPYYSYDPLKCEAEFKASALVSTTGKSLWETGFNLVIPYNAGNLQRQVISEIFQKELAAINPKFIAEPLEMEWPDYLSVQRLGKIPLAATGWIEDYHDTHNWVVPYTVGTLGYRQVLPQDLLNQFADIIQRGVSQADPVQRATIYAEFNQLYYEQAPALLLFIPKGRHYQQSWVDGFFSNPVVSGIYFYALHKN